MTGRARVWGALTLGSWAGAPWAKSWVPGRRVGSSLPGRAPAALLPEVVLGAGGGELLQPPTPTTHHWSTARGFRPWHSWVWGLHWERRGCAQSRSITAVRLTSRWSRAPVAVSSYILKQLPVSTCSQTGAQTTEGRSSRRVPLAPQPCRRRSARRAPPLYPRILWTEGNVASPSPFWNLGCLEPAPSAGGGT